MKATKLADGTTISCLSSAEARILDHHIDGYFGLGIAIHDGATVLDIGANIGVFGVRVLQKWPSARVFACEPVPATFACLRDNAKRVGEDRLIALECGISSQPGTAEITYYPNSPALSTTRPERWTTEALGDAVAMHLEHPPDDLWYVKRLPKFLARWYAVFMRRTSETFDCELKTVSNLIAEHRIDVIDVLKVDCEGAEYDCLMGIEESDWSKVRQVVVEVHDVEDGLARVTARLEQMGLDEMIVEQEAVFRGTKLFNVFARRTRDQ